MPETVAGGLADEYAAILPVEKNISLGGDRQTPRRIKGLEFFLHSDRKVDLFQLEDRPIFTVWIEVLEPVAHPQCGRDELALWKVA